MKAGKLYGVGLGPGDYRLLTLRALEVLRSCGKVFEVVGGNSSDSVSGSILDGAGISKEKRSPLTYTMSKDMDVRRAKIAENAALVAEELLKGSDCVFSTIGDPLIYSTFSYTLKEIRKRIPELEVEVVPGITSFQTAAARAVMPIVEDEETFLLAPCHNEKGLEKAFGSSASSLALLKAFKTKGAIAAKIRESEGAKAVYASRLAMEGELLTTDLAEAEAAPETYLSLFLVKREPGEDA